MEDAAKIIAKSIYVASKPGFVDYLPLLLSLVAIGTAIFIPIIIARRQDKAMLFEMRFAAYMDLLRLKNFADILKGDHYSLNMEDIKANSSNPLQEKDRRIQLIAVHFASIFDYYPKDLGKPDTVQATIAAIKKIETSVNALSLLYSKQLENNGDDASKEISSIFESLFLFIIEIVLPDNSFDDSNRIAFVERTNLVIKKYAEVFELGMRL